jgi:hypothetical protein
MRVKSTKIRANRTTIGVKEATKDRMDACRAPGQCYDGFINQLVDLWEKKGPASRRSSPSEKS